jgi:hypothetical protein
MEILFTAVCHDRFDLCRLLTRRFSFSFLRYFCTLFTLSFILFLLLSQLFISKFNDYLQRTAITSDESNKLCASFLAVLTDWKKSSGGSVKDITHNTVPESPRSKHTGIAAARATGTVDGCV